VIIALWGIINPSIRSCLAIALDLIVGEILLIAKDMDIYR